tara:strand:+ start:1290 stop:1721 length:432 start_codon:yes stop_codon:yes gene_type:complete
LSLKTKIIIYTLSGLIPLYLITAVIHIDSLNLFNIDKKKLDNIILLYAYLIISFLSGMHWQKLILNNKKSFLIYPIFFIVIFWLGIVFINEEYLSILLIFGLCICLLIDLSILKNLNKYWYKKLRIITTFLAILPLTYNFFYQ